jgi:hypothetical protein
MKIKGKIFNLQLWTYLKAGDLISKLETQREAGDLASLLISQLNVIFELLSLEI